MRLRRLWLVLSALLMAGSAHASPVIWQLKGAGSSGNDVNFSMLNDAPTTVPAHSIPEPAALALFGSSLVAIAASIRRRARRSDEPFDKK
jgi:PEP-CTERM motif-containing protein